MVGNKCFRVVTYFGDMARYRTVWRRSAGEALDAILDEYVTPKFGSRLVGAREIPTSIRVEEQDDVYTM